MTCIGFGAMLSLGVFLQPMLGSHGLVPHRHLDGGAPQLALHGRRVVPLGRPLRPVRHARGRALRRPAARRRRWWRRAGPPVARPVPDPVRRAGRAGGRELLHAADGDDHALVHAQPQPRRRAGVGGAQPRLHDRSARSPAGSSRPTTGAPRCSSSATSRGSSIIPAALLVREPPAAPTRRRARWRAGADGRRVHGGAGAAHAAVRRHRAHALRVLRGALGPDLPHGHPRDRPRRPGDGRGHRAQRGRPGLAERPDRLRAHRRPHRRQAHAAGRARAPGRWP